MLKFHGVLTSCRVKRAPHSATIPILGSEAYESVSECLSAVRDPIWTRKEQRVMLCKNVIGCDERCWIISMFQAFPKQLFIAAKERTWTAKKIDQKNSGAPSQVIKDLTLSPAIQCLVSFDKTKIRQGNYISTIGMLLQIIRLNSPPHR